MYETTLAAVEQAWAQTGRSADYPSPETLTQAQRAEAERLEQLIDDRTTELKFEALRAYRQTHQGNSPGYTEHVGMLTQARSAARETVIHEELGESADQAEAEQEQPLVDSNWETDPDRWHRYSRLMQDPAPEIDRMASEIWPDRSTRFQVMGAYLLQVRSEDEQPIPQSLEDPLAASFTAQIERALATRDADLAAWNGQSLPS